MKNFWALFFVLGSAFSFLGAEEKTNLDSVITSVIVFSDRAQVTRSAELTLAQGDYVLVFDMPDSMDLKSVRASGSGNGRIKDVSLITKFVTEISDDRIKALYAEKEKMESELKDDDLKTARINNEVDFLQKMKGKVTGENNTQLAVEKWTALIAFYRTRLDSLDREKQAAEQEQKSIRGKLDKINSKIQDSNAMLGKSKKQVEILFYCGGGGKNTIRLSYIVYNAGWLPVYDLRVDKDEKKVSLSYFGMIRQNTGENWDNTAISLSTAKPYAGGNQPELSAWYIDEARRYPEISSLEEKSEAPKKSGMKDEITRDYKEQAPIINEGAQVDTGATSVDFQIGGRSTIDSDNVPHKLGILETAFDAAFHYSAVPKLSPYAYLKAGTTNITEYPFLPGEAGIYSDNSFVSTSRLELVAPGEEFRMFLGIDEAIRIRHNLVKREKMKSGFLANNVKYRYEYLTFIKNNRRDSVELTLYDQIPIALNAEIKVELLEPELKNTTNVKLNENKTLEWNFSIRPGQELSVPLIFTVEHPENMAVNGL